jgi:hypothetical protein
MELFDPSELLNPSGDDNDELLFLEENFHLHFSDDEDDEATPEGGKVTTDAISNGESSDTTAVDIRTSNTGNSISLSDDNKTTTTATVDTPTVTNEVPDDETRCIIL